MRCALYLLLFYFQKNLTAVLERLKRQEEEAKALQGKSDDLNAVQGQVHKFKKEKENIERDMKSLKAQVCSKEIHLFYSLFQVL